VPRSSTAKIRYLTYLLYRRGARAARTRRGAAF